MNNGNTKRGTSILGAFSVDAIKCRIKEMKGKVVN
jgi:hypothetical protein